MRTSPKINDYIDDIYKECYKLRVSLDKILSRIDNERIRT